MEQQAVKAGALADALGITASRVHYLAKKGVITASETKGKTAFYDVKACKRQLEEIDGGGRQPQPSGDAEEFDLHHVKAIFAAKDAYRKILLDGADECKAAGNLEMESRLLRAFVDAEAKLVAAFGIEV